MFYRNEINEASLNPPAARTYYPWHELEEYLVDGGMWAIPTADMRDHYIRATKSLMQAPEQFLDAMRRAVNEWPKSCAVALGNPTLNRRAWIGHAGCYLATGSPEETTRLGWHELTEYEQVLANHAADDAIREWRAATTSRDQLTLWG